MFGISGNRKQLHTCEKKVSRHLGTILEVYQCLTTEESLRFFPILAFQSYDSTARYCVLYLIYDIILCLLVKSGTFVLQRKCECHVLQFKPHHQEESRILKAYKEVCKLNSYMYMYELALQMNFKRKSNSVIGK